MDTFCKKSGTEKRYVQRWLPIVAAAQLTKKRPEEKKRNSAEMGRCSRISVKANLERYYRVKLQSCRRIAIKLWQLFLYYRYYKNCKIILQI